MPEEIAGAEIARLHAVVHGFVQGVNFRYYTRQQALRLGLRGWVKNLEDGSVEVLAEGPRPALHQLLNYLHIGPASAAVEEVTETWSAAEGAPEGGFFSFEVRW